MRVLGVFMVFFSEFEKCKSEKDITLYIILCAPNKTSKTLETLFLSRSNLIMSSISCVDLG